MTPAHHAFLNDVYDARHTTRSKVNLKSGCSKKNQICSHAEKVNICDHLKKRKNKGNPGLSLNIDIFKTENKPYSCPKVSSSKTKQKETSTTPSCSGPTPAQK